MQNKLVIVINGRGGVGKDTLCDFSREVYRTRVVSAITPIKEIALRYGWNGEKDLKSRKFLSDLKRAFVEYNDLPTRYLCGQYEEFLAGEEQLLFVHCREPEQIDAFRRAIGGNCVTLLVTRDDPALAVSYGNASDDDVATCAYDYYFDNSTPLAESRARFLAFLDSVLKEKGIHF